MKTLVIYDSLYGNTKTVAETIAGAMPSEVTALHVGDVPGVDLGAYDLLIMGGPTHGGGPSEAMKKALEEMEPASLAGTYAAAFDTRITWWWLRPFGYAAARITRSLEKKGASVLVEGEGFLVTGGEGPLKEGELQRADAWAQQLAAVAAGELTVA